MNELLNTRELQQRIALYEDMEACHALYDHYLNSLQYFCNLYSIAKNFCLNYITRHFNNPGAIVSRIDLNKDAVLE